MYDHGETNNKLSSPKGATSQEERRGGNRHPFIAAAEVVEIASGARFSTRTTDLGPGGCFIDTLVPFEAGSKVRVMIREGQNRFEATGLVVYSQAGLGMGIAFDELKEEARRALAGWLGEEIIVAQEPKDASPQWKNAGVPHGSDREALVRLVKLMTTKGVLSAAEAATIFSDPVLF